MKAGLKYSMSLMGLAATWETAKGFIIPTLFWTGTAVGSAEYVHWVVKSHYANLAHTSAGATSAQSDQQDQPENGTLMDDLVDLVTREDAFVESLRGKTGASPSNVERAVAFQRDNLEILKRANQIRPHMPATLAADLAMRIAQIQSLDSELKSFAAKTTASR